MCFTLNELFANKRYQNCIKNNKLHFIRRINHYFIATIRSLLIWCWDCVGEAPDNISKIPNYSLHSCASCAHQAAKWNSNVKQRIVWYVHFSHLIRAQHKSCVMGAFVHTHEQITILLIGFTQPNAAKSRMRKKAHWINEIVNLVGGVACVCSVSAAHHMQRSKHQNDGLILWTSDANRNCSAKPIIKLHSTYSNDTLEFTVCRMAFAGTNMLLKPEPASVWCDGAVF